MSLLPIIRICKHTKVQRLFSQRNVPKHSPLFKLLTDIDQDFMGKHLGRSTTPNCKVHKSVVFACVDIEPGTTLTLSEKPFESTQYLDSL